MSELALQIKLNRLITGYWISQAIFAAAKLGIADLLTAGPKSVDQIAKETGTDNDALYRLLRALASENIFEESERKQFSLTPLAELLRSDVAGSQRALSMMSGDQQFQAWGEIIYSLQTGKTAFDKVFGKPIFDYLSEHPEQARIFDAAMTGIHGRETDSLLKAYDFSGINVLADIGGGNGSNLIGILQKYPEMKGILFDLPHVIERARAAIEQAELNDRCELVAGDFFEAVPPAADAFLMRHIIHDWDDEKSLKILGNCHAAMQTDGKLLVIESVIPPGNEHFAGKFLDLVMLLIPGGKERTAEEYEALYSQAGFKLTGIVPTETELSIIEGIKR